MNQTDIISRTFTFICNLPPDFIDAIWSDNPMLADHLKAKFRGYCLKEGYASANAILKFFMNLDSGNTARFCTYAFNWIAAHPR